MPSKKEQTGEDSVVADESKKRTVSIVSQDFADKVHKQLNSQVKDKLSNKDTKVIVESFIKTLIGDVKEGKHVSFTNMMTFKRVVRDDRVHKNPKTGGDVFKPAHYVMSMEVKPSLKKEFECISVASKCASDHESSHEKEVSDASSKE